MKSLHETNVILKFSCACEGHCLVELKNKRYVYSHQLVDDCVASVIEIPRRNSRVHKGVVSSILIFVFQNLQFVDIFMCESLVRLHSI